MSNELSDSREAFEKIEAASELSRDETGDYSNPCVQSAWEGWQAALAHKSEGAVPVAAPVDASSEQATSTGWVPEILEGPGENVCYTQDNTPRAERKEMVVISAADHDRLRYFASIDEFSYAEETKLLSSISPTVLIGQLRKLRKDLRAAKKAIDPAPHSGEAAPVVADAQAEADLNAVYDVFAIGAKARTISTLLVNCQNASRRSGCLSAIEREFFTTEAPAEDPEEEGDTIEVCPLSWGSNRTEYVEQMRGALAERERIAVEAFKATASSQHVAVSDPVGHFIDDAADGEKPHYSQVAEVFKSAADVIPLYRAPLPRASDAPIGEAAVSDDSARIQDYAEQNMLTLEEAADELRAAPRHDRAPAIGEAGGVVAEEVLAAIKLACESRDIEFNADTPRATVGSLFLWERDNAAQPQAAPSGLSMDRMRELARETLDEGFSGGFYEETLTRLIGRAIAAAQAAGSGA